MPASWLAFLFSLATLARQLMLFFERRIELAARNSEQQARNKARNHDLLLKALKARRDARARHSNSDPFHNNPDKLPDD